MFARGWLVGDGSSGVARLGWLVWGGSSGVARLGWFIVRRLVVGSLSWVARHGWFTLGASLWVVVCGTGLSCGLAKGWMHGQEFVWHGWSFSCGVGGLGILQPVLLVLFPHALV